MLMIFAFFFERTKSPFPKIKRKIVLFFECLLNFDKMKQDALGT